MNFHQSHHSLKGTQQQPSEKMSMEIFEQANLALLTTLQQK